MRPSNKVLQENIHFPVGHQFPKWRIALSSPCSFLSTPTYLSSSGRFFIQLLSCKKVLLLLTSWKPCCLSVVPCVVVLMSNNRKMKPQEIQCHGIECVFANLEILRGASDVQPPSSRLEPPVLFQSRMHWQERTNPTPIIKDNITYKTARVPTETTCARYEALPCTWECRTTGLS